MESSDSPGRMLRFLKAIRPNTLLKALSGAAVLWTFLVDDGTVAMSIHQAFYDDEWNNADLLDSLVIFLGYAASLPVAPVVSAVLTRRCGPRVRGSTGKSLFRQFREQLSLTLRSAVPPPWYYVFELYDDQRRARSLEYLYRFETKAALYDSLRRLLSDPAAAEALSDKAAFALRCEAHHLPCVPVLATARRGRVQRLDGGAGLPRCDLFFKPIRGAGGRGASRWTWMPQGLYQRHQGPALDETGLAAYLAVLSRTEDYLVRAYVTNHAGMLDLAGSVLSTVRVVTCINETGQPEVTHAVLRMASSTRVVVDNFHAGGIAAAVDLSSGRLGPATDMGLRADSRWWDYHPLTGAAITGRELPLWLEVLELARSAHLAFRDQVAIGWDIAICDQGPLLVEGNKSPDLDIIQRVYREPLGNTRFGELLLHHVGRARKLALSPVVLSALEMSTAPLSSASFARGVNAVNPESAKQTGGAPPSALVARVFEIPPGADLADPELRSRALETVEGGGLVLLHEAGFTLNAREQSLVANAAVTLPTRKERESRNGRPTVIYDPGRGRILHARMPSPGREELEALMARYSNWTADLLDRLFPVYAGRLARDRLTYRPCERADQQGLHVDASYGRPTEGRGMLRVFCNINPAGQPRVWRVGETFEPFARRYLPTARPPRAGRLESLLATLGITHGRRTAYDRLMADIRGQVKKDAEYQRSAPQRVLSFPPGAVWIAITDLVLHGASTGQHSLDQTYFLPAEVMREPERASLRILERLSGGVLL